MHFLEKSTLTLVFQFECFIFEKQKGVRDIIQNSLKVSDPFCSCDPEHLHTTSLGQRFLNDVIAEFLL